MFLFLFSLLFLYSFFSLYSFSFFSFLFLFYFPFDFSCNIITGFHDSQTFSSQPIQPVSVGLITPYSAQSELIQQQLENINKSLDSNVIKVVCKTVDGFQGQECDIILFLSVRSNNEGGLGFLRDFRRLNVAITRGRFSLLIIGNCVTLERNKIWNGLIQTAKNNGCVHTSSTSPLIEKVINNYEKEIIKIKKLKNPTSKLFENSFWSVRIMEMFKKSFPSITDKNKRERIISLLLRLGDGKWLVNNGYQGNVKIGDNNTDFSSIIFTVPMGADVLIWSIDLQVS